MAEDTWGLSGGYKAPRVKAGTVVKAPSTYQGSPYAQGQDMFTVAPTKQLATTSQDILAGKGTIQGLGTSKYGAVGANPFQQSYNDMFGTNYGNTFTGNATTTPDQQMFEANNQGAYMDDMGNWKDKSGNIMSTDTGASTGAGLAGTVGGIASGIGAAAGLANAYLGYKNYGLAKDKFAFEKAATNRSIANQASEYNTGIQNAGEVGMALAGGTMDPNARAARQAQLEGQKISGLAIG